MTISRMEKRRHGKCKIIAGYEFGESAREQLLLAVPLCSFVPSVVRGFSPQQAQLIHRPIAEHGFAIDVAARYGTEIAAVI